MPGVENCSFFKCCTLVGRFIQVKYGMLHCEGAGVSRSAGTGIGAFLFFLPIIHRKSGL
jgi:hypothetical protein